METEPPNSHAGAIRVAVSRRAIIPDGLRVARYLRAPELGPKVVFFSGGSALRPLSRTLKQYTHNSVHLITAFDSGGSSAPLRQAFSMPAIGDLRNRIVALADESVRGNPQIYRLFCHRLPIDESPTNLAATLAKLVSGEHFLVAEIPQPMRQIVRSYLEFFAGRMPTDFDLRGANLGNLLLTGGYLATSRDLNSVTFLFSKLLEVRGVVRPIVDANLHLLARLADGTKQVGQHRITRPAEPRQRPGIDSVDLIADLESAAPASTAIDVHTRQHILGADLICLPMGSFYTSLLSNFLPRGAGAAVSAAGCPRVYIPNTGRDSEQEGMTVADSLRTLIDSLRRDAGSQTPTDQLVNIVLLDRNSSKYAMPLDLSELRSLGVSVVETDLSDDADSEEHPARTTLHPKKLTEALLSLA